MTCPTCGATTEGCRSLRQYAGRRCCTDCRTHHAHNDPGGRHAA